MFSVADKSVKMSKTLLQTIMIQHSISWYFPVISIYCAALLKPTAFAWLEHSLKKIKHGDRIVIWADLKIRTKDSDVWS